MSFPYSYASSGSFAIGTTGEVVPSIYLSDTALIPTIFNSGRLDIDFRILPTGSNLAGLFFDASNSRLGINTTQPSHALHLVDICENGGFKIESTTDCVSGVVLQLYHNPLTPPSKNDYPSTINLNGRDINGTEISYAQIRSKILDPSSSSPSGELIFLVNDSGVLRSVYKAGSLYNVIGIKNNTINSTYYAILGNENSLNQSDRAIILGSTNNVSNFYDGLLVGHVNSVSGINNMLIASATIVSGENNLIYGRDNHHKGYESILIGVSGNVQGNQVFVLGNYATISGDSSISVGSHSSISGDKNLSFGNNNLISNSGVGDNLIYGNSGILEQVYQTISIGNNQSIISSSSGIFIGNNISSANNNKTIIVGLDNNHSSFPNSMVVGVENDISNDSSHTVIYGQYNNLDSTSGVVVLGQNNSIDGYLRNTIVGSNNYLLGNDGNYNHVVGVSNSGSVTGVVLVGSLNKVAGFNQLVNGHQNYTSGNNNTRYGSFGYVDGDHSIVEGNKNISLGNNNVSIGNGTRSYGNNIISIGGNSTYGDGALNIGRNDFVVSGVVVGDSNRVDNINNVVYGKNNSVKRQSENPDRYNFTIANNRIVTSSSVNNTDILGLYFTNIQGPNNFIVVTAEGKSTEGVGSSFDFNVSLGDLLNLPSDTIESLFNNTVPSGTLVVLGSSTNNVVVGLDNSSNAQNNIVIGRDNSVGGSNNLVIGNNLTASFNNGVLIGSDNNNIKFADQYIDFNTTNTQSGVRFYANNGNGELLHIDFNNETVSVSGSLVANDELYVKHLYVSGSAENGWVLTRQSDNKAEWTQPLAINDDVQSNSLLVALDSSTISGINDVRITDNTLFIFDQVEFSADVSSFQNNIISNQNITAINITGSASVNAGNLVVNNSVFFPANLRSGLLHVNASNELVKSSVDNDSVLYFPSGGPATGSSTFVYNNNNIYLSDTSPTQPSIVLSTSNNENTVFNKSQILTNNFAILQNNNDQQNPDRGLYYSSEGVLSVNSVSGLSFNDNVRLDVAGKIATNQLLLRPAENIQSGHFLQAIDAQGNAAWKPLIPIINQTGTYPLRSSLIQGTNSTLVSLTDRKLDESFLEGGNGPDGGSTLIFNGGNIQNRKWQVSPNFRARAGECGSNCYVGIELGTSASILSNHMMAFGSASFNNLSNSKYKGSSQLGVYQLLTDTSGVQVKELTTTYPNTNITYTNTIAFNNTVIDANNADSHVRNYVWQYNVSINAIWQSGNDISTIDAGSFVYEGSIIKIGQEFKMVGSPLSRSYLPTNRPDISGIILPTSNNGIPRLQILASGNSSNYKIKWSAVANIHQINLPSGAFDFSFTN